MSPKEEIEQFLKQLHENKSRILDYVGLQRLVLEDFNNRKIEKMKRGLRRDRLTQSLLAHREVFIEHEPTQTMVYYEVESIDPEDYTPRYSAIYISILKSSKGRVYVVRITGIPNLIFIKAHLWDRYQQRLQETGHRSDAILQIFAYWQSSFRRREAQALFDWDEKTLEQFVVIPDGLMLGCAAHYPIMSEFLNPLPDFYKQKFTVVVVLSTFITPEMFSYQQKIRVEDIIKKSEELKK